MNPTDTLKTAILNTTNFSALETLRGMILGYYTSPLISKYGFDDLIPCARALREGDFGFANPPERKKFRSELLDTISDMMKVVNNARRDGLGEETVGSYNIGGVRIPKIVTRELPSEISSLIISGFASTVGLSVQTSRLG